MTHRRYHPTITDLAGRGYSLIGTTVVLGKKRGRWRSLLMNRSTAAVMDYRFPSSVRSQVVTVAADLARLHALTTGITSWCVPSGELEVIEMHLPTVAEERVLLDMLLADIGDPTGLQHSAPIIAAAVAEVNAHRLVRDRRRSAGPVVDKMATRLAGGGRW